mmetsp:Transcript_3534/g.5797  ORF Transcript_3534/g.5797 Transcript_3534/m.5797 type:complete len:228 (-) Transcript_3534:381-1064(-)
MQATLPGGILHYPRQRLPRGRYLGARGWLCFDRWLATVARVIGCNRASAVPRHPFQRVAGQEGSGRLPLLAIHGQDLLGYVFDHVLRDLKRRVPLPALRIVGKLEVPLGVRCEILGGQMSGRGSEAARRELQADGGAQRVVDEVPCNLSQVPGALDALHVGEKRPVSVLDREVEVERLQQDALADEDLLLQLKKFFRVRVGCLLSAVVHLVRLAHHVPQLFRRLLYL